MKICLDLRYKTESGGSSYIKNIVPAILKSAPQHRYFGIVNPGQRLPFLDGFEKLLSSPSNGDAAYMGWTLLRVPTHLKRLGIDLYHGMKLPGPWRNPARTIHTMHSVLRDKAAGFPSTVSARVFVALYGAPILKRLDRFIAVSEFVRNDLIDVHGVDAARIEVVPHGLDSRFQLLPAATAIAAASARGLRRYAICVGNVFPVKNHLTAVRAFARLAGRFPDLDLAIAGGLQDAYASRVTAEIARLGLGDRVKMLGMVPPDELAALLNGAQLLLFPSVTEGFGIAVLEAMACGLPSVVARIGALAELDATFFVDNPFDDAAFAAHAARLISDPALREDARRRALETASRFTWERSAAGHLAAYDHAMAGPRAVS